MYKIEKSNAQTSNLTYLLTYLRYYCFTSWLHRNAVIFYLCVVLVFVVAVTCIKLARCGLTQSSGLCSCNTLVDSSGEAIGKRAVWNSTYFRGHIPWQSWTWVQFSWPDPTHCLSGPTRPDPRLKWNSGFDPSLHASFLVIANYCKMSIFQEVVLYCDTIDPTWPDPCTSGNFVTRPDPTRSMDGPGPCPTL